MSKHIDQATDAELRELANQAQADAQLDQTLTELAMLPLIEYDLVRKDMAEKLGKIRVTTLDAEVEKRRPKPEANRNAEGRTIVLTDPEPWPDSVNIGSVLMAIRSAIKRFIVVSDAAITAIALWIVHTYAHEAANVSPILAIVSPTKRCGKTKLLGLLTALVIRPLPTANVTAATVFRGIQAFRPTLLVDEADCFINDRDELRGILNSGHHRSTAIVLRTVGEEHEVKAFSTWCPKAIAKIGKLPETLQDRSIVIEMRRRSSDEKVDRLNDRVAAELEPLRQKMARWFQDNRHVLAMAEPKIPDGIDDRAADNWQALLAIADTAGGDWPKMARDALTELCGVRDDEDESAPTILLTDIRQLFNDRQTDKLWSEDIVSALKEMENRPWPEWKSGKPITQRQLANLLKPFKIKSDDIKLDNTVKKGYRLEQFSDAFRRYLSPVSATSATARKNKDLTGSVSATEQDQVADKKAHISHQFSEVAQVADVKEGNAKRI